VETTIGERVTIHQLRPHLAEDILTTTDKKNLVDFRSLNTSVRESLATWLDGAVDKGLDNLLEA
jgi:hypothetical protein